MWLFSKFRICLKLLKAGWIKSYCLNDFKCDIDCVSRSWTVNVRGFQVRVEARRLKLRKSECAVTMTLSLLSMWTAGWTCGLCMNSWLVSQLLPPSRGFSHCHWKDTVISVRFLLLFRNLTNVDIAWSFLAPKSVPTNIWKSEIHSLVSSRTWL